MQNMCLKHGNVQLNVTILYSESASIVQSWTASQRLVRQMVYLFHTFKISSGDSIRKEGGTIEI